MVGDQALLLEEGAGTALLQLQCVAKHFREEGQCESL